MRRPFSLSFYGGAYAAGLPRYRIWHETADSARDEAQRVHRSMQERGLPTACHQALVFGPGLPAGGEVVSHG